MQTAMDFGAVGWMVSALAAVALLCLLLWRKRWARRADGPTCGQCGYDVRGLPSSICPECGSDLKTVGIVEPGTARAGVGVKVLYWTLLMAMITPAVVSLGMRYGPAYRWGHVRFNLVPKSGAYTGASIFYSARGWGLLPYVETVKCMIDPPNRIAVVIEVYGREMGYSCPNEKWQRTQGKAGFDESVVLMGMRAGAVDTSSEQVRAEAAELCRIIRSAMYRERSFQLINFAFDPVNPGLSMISQAWWIRYVYLGLCVVIWCAGCWWMARRERQKRERPVGAISDDISRVDDPRQSR